METKHKADTIIKRPFCSRSEPCIRAKYVHNGKVGSVCSVCHGVFIKVANQRVVDSMYTRANMKAPVNTPEILLKPPANRKQLQKLAEAFSFANHIPSEVYCTKFDAWHFRLDKIAVNSHNPGSDRIEIVSIVQFDEILKCQLAALWLTESSQATWMCNDNMVPNSFYDFLYFLEEVIKNEDALPKLFSEIRKINIELNIVFENIGLGSAGRKAIIDKLPNFYGNKREFSLSLGLNPLTLSNWSNIAPLSHRKEIELANNQHVAYMKNYNKENMDEFYLCDNLATFAEIFPIFQKMSCIVQNLKNWKDDYVTHFVPMYEELNTNKTTPSYPWFALQFKRFLEAVLAKFEPIENATGLTNILAGMAYIRAGGNKMGPKLDEEEQSFILKSPLSPTLLSKMLKISVQAVHTHINRHKWDNT